MKILYGIQGTGNGHISRGRVLAKHLGSEVCHTGLKHDLCRTNAVICNTGFELVSECLHLGLPVLTKPVSGHMEQQSNALALRQLGYADVIPSVDIRGRAFFDQTAQRPETLRGF